MDLRLYGILDVEAADQAAGALAGAAVAGGVTAVQVRAKTSSTGLFLEAVEQVTRAVDGQAAVFVNDRVDVAALAGADGVHVGDEDLSVDEVRRQLSGAVVGRTAREPAAARRAEADGAGYVGAGCVFPSATKPGLPLIGIDGLERVAAAVCIPVVAIGGIDAANAAACIEAGAAGVAVARGIFGRPGEVAPAARSLAVRQRAEALRAVVDAARGVAGR